MTKRYNIALIPKTITLKLIHFAEQFKNLKYNYLISEFSLPHITICQFRSEELELEKLWQQVMMTVSLSSLNLAFNTFSYFTNTDGEWLALKPNSRTQLKTLHTEVLPLIKQPLGRCGKNYDPHLTLFNTQQLNHATMIATFSKINISIADQFTLSLGLADEQGQYLRVIFSLS